MTATTTSTRGPNWRNGKARIDAIAAKAQKTFVVTNNHFEGQAAVNALQLKSMLAGGNVKVPATLRSRYWELGEISSPDE